MNEFIEQFILESRELVEQASTALALLEHSPNDAENIDALFRAFHTLKGGASIVDFFAMERAVHAAEDMLSQARAEKKSFADNLIDDCYACLDQVLRWLEVMERCGEVPLNANGETDAQANLIIARFGHVSEHENVQPAQQKIAQRWLEDFLKRNPSHAPHAKTAVRFTPRADSFFRGEDPLALIASLPDLLALDLEPNGVWPTLDVLDSFESVLVLTALSGATPHEVSTHLIKNLSECEIVAVGSDTSVILESDFSKTARSILEAQIALLNDTQTSAFAGRVASAGLVAANVLRYRGRNEHADLIAQATEKSLAQNDARHLREQISHCILSTPLSSTIVPSAIASAALSPVEGSVRTLRVDAERIDALVRLIGELTVVKNAIGHAVKLAQAEDNTLLSTLLSDLKTHQATLDHLTSELQTAVLSIRVLPLRTVLQRFSRVVREMSSSLDKPVKLVIEGDDTEADKAIVEMLFEPLLHIVRNSMDHGIENPQLRAQKNKAPTATILIRAARQGDHVCIEVNDDGGGVDVARVREVAKERGVVSAEDLDGMSEADTLDLIFAPGFSTAAAVTELSGRGVGMDAVRTAVARVGGKVSIESQAGLGATVKFTLPFSVMMTHVMTVEAGGQMFGIPLEAVVETISVPADTIVDVGAAQAIVRRDRTIPVFDLATVLRVQAAPRAEGDAVIVIASFAGELGGILVDHVGERMGIMLKPLEGLLLGVPGIVGTTILGDGRVLLVLDLDGLLQ